MAASVVDGVEMRVESDGAAAAAGAPALEVRLLGPLAVRRRGAAVTLPASKKVRALLAYLALAPCGVGRSPLCELLWDVPNDPRGELRWCLSKLRRVVDDETRTRVVTADELVRLDLSDCVIDALEIERALASGIAALEVDAAEALRARCRGELLEGLELGTSAGFTAWLAAQRRRFRGARVALLDHLATRLPDGEALACIGEWLQLAPFERRPHELLLAALAREGRLQEGDAHLAATTVTFEAEGLDPGPLHHAWRAARARPADAATGVASRAPTPEPGTASRRASIAVMPFVDAMPSAVGGGLGDALVYDVIARLAKLRSLFVIAQGTVFALKERRVAPDEAGRMLGVDYVASGSVRPLGERLAVAVELAEARSARVVWSERFEHPRGEALAVLDAIGDRVVASIDSEIEMRERNRAVLKPPSSLDAWEAHHRGLWHMYRFNRADNAAAQQFFARAVKLDPTFSRAYAGLSFTHWQNAFQGWADRAEESDRALAAAGQGMLVDDRDPAVHWAQGRALWLRGRHEESVVELGHSVALSPNFAQGHYALAFVQSQAGDPEAAIAASDLSRNLSPFDPLLFGMLGARAMALVRLGRIDEAAAAAVKAAARPNAHVHIFAIAAFSLALDGALDEATRHANAIRHRMPGYTADDFFRAFRFDAEGEARFREGARRLGMA